MGPENEDKILLKLDSCDYGTEKSTEKLKTKNFLLLSDPHYKRHPGDFHDELRKIERIADDYDCEELIIAGDIGYSWQLNELMDIPLSYKYVIGGNHDKWSEDILVSMGFKSPEGNIPQRDGVMFDSEENSLKWDLDLGYDKYKIELHHKYRDFGLKGFFDTRITGGPDKKDADILIHGHSHIPYFRVIDGGILAIGAGSMLENSSNHCDYDVPNRSAQVLEVNSSVIVEHLDFDSEKIFDVNEFEKNSDGFKRV